MPRHAAHLVRSRQPAAGKQPSWALRRPLLQQPASYSGPCLCCGGVSCAALQVEDLLDYYLQRAASTQTEAERLLAGARDLEESIGVSPVSQALRGAPQQLLSSSSVPCGWQTPAQLQEHGRACCLVCCRR